MPQEHKAISLGLVFIFIMNYTLTNNGNDNRFNILNDFPSINSMQPKPSHKTIRSSSKAQMSNIFPIVEMRPFLLYLWFSISTPLSHPKNIYILVLVKEFNSPNLVNWLQTSSKLDLFLMSIENMLFWYLHRAICLSLMRKRAPTLSLLI